ncbi:Leucine-rich repeat protein kinase family protein [Abeliophyllum distichum]|uniref:non-specific serine/threonine protein kinase n=1 Tax=Abeliophyllum distichum TaxID=126358 RepID=A0ABD1R975_9LAMI
MGRKTSHFDCDYRCFLLHNFYFIRAFLPCFRIYFSRKQVITYQSIKMARLAIRGCFWAVLLYICVQFAVAQKTDPSEVTVLVAVKSSLIDHMKRLSTWNKGDPCTSNWTGVLCSDVVGGDGYLHIKELQLMNMHLSGNLAPELGQLSQLEILNFMWNDLTGTLLKEIGNIKSLKLLLLSGNRLTGSLPEEIGNLSEVDRIQIDQNSISGPIPKSIINLKRLKHLHFNNNSLSGQIPFELTNVSTIYHLLLDNNNLTGYLPPELSKLPNLRILQLDNNNFSGSDIPASYGDFINLVKMSLRNCSLGGTIPDLSRVANLSYIDLSWNGLSGSIPVNKLSDNMTTIDLSNNHLNGSIPESFSLLPKLQNLLLENNVLSGSIPTDIWRNKSFSANAILTIDLRNNSLSNILGEINPPANITFRLQGNPICHKADMLKVDRFCGPNSGMGYVPSYSTNSTMICPIQACPVGNYFEYVPASPIPCFCASPILIGYRLKSPSFSYLPPYKHTFELYLTSSLTLLLYQLYIDSSFWEEGPRLRMYLKLFPVASTDHSSLFNTSEILRIRSIFTTWELPRDDFYGPYELLNFTLAGPYSYVNFNTQGKGIRKGLLISIIVGAVVFAVIISAIMSSTLTKCYTKYRILSRKRFSSKLSIKIEGVRSFTFKEMALATNNFNSCAQVGQGGYGTVYKGILYDSTTVAIKRAKERSLQGKKEFLTEIELLSRLHHRNLVSLVGYCDEEGEQMLVYEFMPKGTLRDWLSGESNENLEFGVRLRVALGSAKGILYLHTEANPPIFHRDIKASNILLDSKLTAKVADFGLSRLAPALNDEGMVPNHVSTLVKGTPGYLDPEYFLTHKLTDKSDVYSFGVVLLEILTGMHPISHGKNIVREVNMTQKSGTLFSIIDRRMGSYPSECMEKFVPLALSCCQDKPEERPSMLEVVRELENILRLVPDAAEINSSDFKSKYFSESMPSSSTRTKTASDDLNVSGGYLSSLTLTVTPR